MRITHFRHAVGLLLLSASPVIAQTTAPGTAASSGGMGWLWIVLLLIVVGAAVWYFAFRGKWSRGSSSLRGSSSMGVDREQAKGSIKEGVGNVLGDAKLKAEGRIDKAEGQAQNTAGGIKDTLRGQ